MIEELDTVIFLRDIEEHGLERTRFCLQRGDLDMQ
jgi:hypothetical protein